MKGKIFPLACLALLCFGGYAYNQTRPTVISNTICTNSANESVEQQVPDFISKCKEAGTRLAENTKALKKAVRARQDAQKAYDANPTPDTEAELANAISAAEAALAASYESEAQYHAWLDVARDIPVQ